MASKEVNEIFAKPDEESDKAAASESQPEKAKEEEAPAPSTTEQKPEVADKSPQEKEVPFHKHPRWVRREKDYEETKAKLDEALKKLESQPAPKQEEKKVSQVPPQFQKLFGEDVEAYEQWSKLLDDRAEAKAKAFYEQQKAEETRATSEREAASKKAVTHAENVFLELEEETGKSFTAKDSTERNQILNLIERLRMFDENGFPNIRSAYELYQELHPSTVDKTVEEKKKVIAKTAAKGTGSPQEGQFLTSAQLRKKSVHQFFN
jgi:hypothetical protein